jgi:hypothetical protein
LSSCHAGGKLAQGVQARHLAQLQQLLGAPARHALAQQLAQRREQGGAARQPAQHAAPRQHGRAHRLLHVQHKGLACGGQRFCALPLPACSVSAAPWMV